MPTPVDQPGGDTAPADEAADPAPKQRKWGDLAALAAPVAAGTAVGVASTQPTKATTVAAPAASRPNALLARRLRSTTPSRIDAEASSEFNSKANRLVDFQLPDLDGQPVRFRDLDADFVILDFWGTWCKECVDSIPALVALQKKYGPNKLKVVGIACEKTSVDRRKALVATAAAKLGINYSILVASMDGTDPVQRDFQVRFYPTLVLLDRSGKVLFRGEGGTKTNLFRLERAMTTAQRSTQTARR